MIRLLTVHPTRMTCELIAAVLREEADIHIIGYAQNGDEALEHLRRQPCDVVLIDINLANNSALRLARKVNESWKEVNIIITGLVKSNAAILHCVEEGVAGYVHEEESLGDLVKKIRAVHEGEFIVSPTMASVLMARVAELKQMTKELYGISTGQIDDLFTELTPREWEVLQLIEQGLNNQKIAEKLVIEKGTVKNHVHNILNKLNVHRREQAALLIRQMQANTPKAIGSTTDGAKEDFALNHSLESITRRGTNGQRMNFS